MHYITCFGKKRKQKELLYVFELCGQYFNCYKRFFYIAFLEVAIVKADGEIAALVDVDERNVWPKWYQVYITF